MSVKVIEKGTPYYSGRHASVPEKASHDIKLPEGWAMFALSPSNSNKEDVAVSAPKTPSSMERNFLLQPARRGGVTTFATI